MTIRFIELLLLLSILSLSIQASAEQWEDLDAKEKESWTNIVSPLLRSEFKKPGNDYKYYIRLEEALNSESVDLATSQTGWVEDYIEKQIALELLKKELLKKQEKPSEDVIEQWANRHAVVYGTTESVDLLSVYIRKFEEESSSSALTRSKAALASIQKGQPFAKVAMRFSDARSAALGGSVGTVYPGKISPELEKIAFSIPVGKVVGPIESSNGYYLLKVTNRRKPFSLSNKEDRERITRDIQTGRLGVAIEEITELWKKNNSYKVYEKPQDPANWFNEPWIKVENGPVVNFSYLYMLLNNVGLNTEEPGEWNDYYAEEAAINAPFAFATLAAYDVTSKSASLKTAMELAVPVFKVVVKFQSWYRKLMPNDGELKKYLEQNKTSFPSVETYSFLLWQMGVETLNNKEAGSDSAAKYTKLLNAVYRISKDKKFKGTDEANIFLTELKNTFADSKITSHTNVESMGPFIDPILVRTQEGALSRPYDSGSGVAILFMVGKSTKQRSFEDIKPTLVDSWKNDKLNKMVSAVKKRAGIKE